MFTVWDTIVVGVAVVGSGLFDVVIDTITVGIVLTVDKVDDIVDGDTKEGCILPKSREDSLAIYLIFVLCECNCSKYG